MEDQESERPIYGIEKKQSEEEEKVRVKSTSYVWATQPSKQDMMTLTEDLSELSVYAAGEMVLKSHIYSALGAALYEGRNIIIWVDYPLSIVQKFGIKKETRRSYWNQSLKTRYYNCVEFDDEIFGLSPACQEFRMKDDKSFREYGIYLKKGVFGFQDGDWNEEIRYLVIDKDEVTKEPTTSKLKKWLRMDHDEGKLAEDKMNELKKRNEEMKMEKEAKVYDLKKRNEEMKKEESNV